MNDRIILICRPGFEQPLREEILQRLNGETAPEAASPAGGGFCEVQGPIAHAARRILPRIVFARQWLDRPGWIEAAELSPLSSSTAESILAGLVAAQRPWTIHAYGSTAEGEGSLTGAALRIEAAVLVHAEASQPPLFARYVAPRDAADPSVIVLQLCLTPRGLWHCTMKVRELLDPHPGGIHRKGFDPASPSRSYLKIEEAFDILGEEPRAGQRVVDLGASPGGWSYAFLRRGCRVIAVDRGPMKVSARPGSGAVLEHVTRDGISYQPPESGRPVDWLASDMLVAPGQTLGMLRKWIEGRWMRRFVINIKIPQQHPYPAIRPVEDYLQTRRDLTFRIRHLYHDRREVTLLGRVLGGRR